MGGWYSLSVRACLAVSVVLLAAADRPELPLTVDGAVVV
jgi:hypothetical protein